MTLIAAVIVVVAATTLFTLSIRTKDLPKPDPVSPTYHLEERKARIYENLRDLQFEYRVGKLSDADYQRTKLSLQQELAGVLAEIDRMAPPTGAKHVVHAAAKAAAAPQAAPKPAPAVGVVCPHCGANFANPMKFCGECGKAMA
ncbi:MAG: hypothetical protein ABSB35_15925 [Bryobacteraceae bacterium]|jgi:hypothetical protein